MNIDDLKRRIEEQTGVPASLLTGETAEENIAQAKAILAFKKENEAQRTKTTEEQLGEWLDAVQGIEHQDPAAAALADIEEAVRVDAGGYPIVKDGGQIDTTGAPDPRPTREQFADWLGRKTAFDPTKDTDGWKSLF